MATKLEKMLATAIAQEGQMAELRHELAQRNIEADKAAKALAQEKSNASMWLTKVTAAQDEVKQIHALLDAMPSPPPRKLKTTEPYDSEVTLTLMTRFAAWLATDQSAGDR